MGLLVSLAETLFGMDSPEFIGKVGENRIAQKLGWVSFCGREGKLLQNVYIPKDDGTTTEIDLLYITVKGLFVIESKNYSGYVFGDDRSPKWTVTLYGGKDWLGRNKVEKHQFYNPIWQNRSHIKYLKQYIGANIQTISIIVFSDRCELKSISHNQTDFGICNRKKLPRIMKEAWNSYPDTLTQSQIEELYNLLLPLTNVSEETKQLHIHDINTMVNGVGMCPRCGGKLVLRLAKSGPNAGSYFLGCSNYPKCRYTKSVEQKEKVNL